MAWEKIGRRVGTGCCPKCQNPGFDYVSDNEWRKDENARVKCPVCGWTGLAREMAIILDPKGST
jgi:hypothetical protein